MENNTSVILLISLLALGGYVWWQSVFRNGLIDIDQRPRLNANFQVDINSAPWPEFANLPGIGDGTARAIVKRREQMGQFQSTDDLLTVRGIGPKKLKSIQRYLLPVHKTKPHNPNRDTY